MATLIEANLDKEYRIRPKTEVWKYESQYPTLLGDRINADKSDTRSPKVVLPL
ncbi:putative protein [Arabidopsis thaliana]|uniref:Uncharacterized protein T14K23_80 n=1 Tax=Arabidopsis thaliana TaxID=3702 RepID=Q9M3F9_ARATH|nr:putative protein [Arabidopsis thaliana]